MLMQTLIGYSLFEGIPGIVPELDWYLRWVQPMLTIGLIGAALASGVLAAVARWRYADTGWALYVVMVPLVLIVVFIVGELIPPYH